MAAKGDSTRARIVSAAEKLILERGYAGSSLDDVLKATGLTKGAFFHHFRGKADLAKAVVEAYARADLGLFEAWSREADAATDDPYERVMLYLTAFERFIDSLGQPFPGCVFAAYTYERLQFEADIHAFVREQLEAWIAMHEEKLQALIDARPPREPVTARALAEMIASLIEGAIVMANAFEDPTWLQRQSAQYRSYLKLLFA